VCEHRAHHKTARCSISVEMDKRKVHDAIDELTTDAKFATVYRVAWLFTKTLDKNIEKFEA